MAHSEGDEILMSGEATGGGDSDEEIEVTAAEVLVQLENVSFYLSSLNHIQFSLESLQNTLVESLVLQLCL